jgi:TrmH RNA methyltransferase
MRKPPVKDAPRRVPHERKHESAARGRDKNIDMRAQKREEARLYGINACLKFFEHRPELLVKVYLTDDTAPKFGAVMKYCAEKRLVYRIVAEQELEKITASAHHEGVCFVIKKPPVQTVDAWLREHGRAKRMVVLALEQVGNPHNLGAILRNCANFGAPAVAVSDAAVLMSGAAIRTAEGGAEFVDVIHFNRMPEMLQAFHKAGFKVAVTSSHDGVDLYETELPEKLLILLGEEMAGLSKRTLAAGDIKLMIPGTGKVESLNVATSSGILLAEFWRQHQD